MVGRFGSAAIGLGLWLAVIAGGFCHAAPPATEAKPELPPTNSDESQVRDYTLPDPLNFADARPPWRRRADWYERRRPQLLGQFTHDMFGKSPPAPKGQSSK